MFCQAYIIKQIQFLNWLETGILGLAFGTKRVACTEFQISQWQAISSGLASDILNSRLTSGMYLSLGLANGMKCLFWIGYQHVMNNEDWLEIFNEIFGLANGI